jgi:hypothetical protein
MKRREFVLSAATDITHGRNLRRTLASWISLVYCSSVSLAFAADLTGRVDSSMVDMALENRIEVYKGAVSADRLARGLPTGTVADVLQDENACTFSYSLRGLSLGLHTVALVVVLPANLGPDKRRRQLLGTGRLEVADSSARFDFHAQNVLRVGGTDGFKTVAEASAAARDGSVIEINAGEYPDDIVVWRHNHVTVRSIGGRAYVHGMARIAFAQDDDSRNGKGLWVVRGNRMRIENMEFSGARVTDQNGAAIRGEGRDLSICNGYFHDNENGFLGGAHGTLTIEYSQFARNGRGDGYTHNVYVTAGNAPGDRLVFRHNYSHDARIGHTLKTRARENYILYNRFADETEGTSSYNIEVPNGGLTYVIGNVIQQGEHTDNATMVSYGAEGLVSGRVHAFYLINNTFVNDRGSGGFVATSNDTAVFRSTNNLFVSGGTVYAGLQPQASTNLQTSDPKFANPAGRDYRLAPASPAVNAGRSPGWGNGFDLTPVFEFRQPAERQRRPLHGAIDIGAYEFVP